MIKKISIVIAIATALIGFLFLNGNSDSIEASMVVTNKTNEQIVCVGISCGDKTIFNKTNGESFYFPKKLIDNMDTIYIVAIVHDGHIAQSGKFSLKNNSNISITGIDNNKLTLSTNTKENIDRLYHSLQLDNWQIKIEENLVEASYQEETDLKYKLYVLGKGGKLGMSDIGSDNEIVSASWEKPDSKLDSWIVFAK
ncbi:MAG: conjugal transfer protein [Christensenellales bacterium]|jgi:hypothetical protein